MQELDRTTPGATELPTLTSFDPATGEVLGTVPIMGPEQVGAAVALAREAFPAWRDLGFEGRRRKLLALRDTLVRHKDDVARLYTRENGKPLAEAMTSVLACCDFLAYYAKHAAGLLADEPIHVSNPLQKNHETFLTYEAKGVVAVISPWNYPLLLAMAEISAALAAGNAVVLKPSELTPLLGVKLGELAREAGLPAGIFAVVTGDGRTGAALTAAPVDRVCFTGSVATGTKVGQAAMAHLVPVTLELGGKDPALVLPDADLDFAAQGLVWGAFTNAGQVCASVERAYVHQRIAEPLIAKVVERAKALVVGNGLDPKTEVGPLINQPALERIEAQVADAVAKGARVLTGGQRLPGPGTFYPPTVLVDVTPDMLVMQDETFGPLLPIISVPDEAAMLAAANDSPFGLSATIWTADLDAGKRLARQIQAGSVWINTGLASYGNPLTPRGGYKESGIGKIGGRHGLLEMVNAKLVDVAVHGKPKLWWYPTWPAMVDFVSAGVDVMHGSSIGQRLSGLGKFLKSRR
ncbi:MAG: Succinate-semialdehyde dehydrogenase [Cyanobacteria bacterium RYN_339]|nr:Succinate-semialdehyde dehydrogenase [Cyanobacteria bacterium RYN_339]